MSKDKGPWREGGRAWERLAGWYRHGPGGPPGPGDPLAALGDVGFVRRLLDEAELEAVRGARRRGSSWAEIATRLGVTRQSAWERWRDLDVAADPPAAGPTPVEPPLEEALLDMEREAVLSRAARVARRQAWLVVPLVVGMTFEDARVHLAERGLVGLPADPDGPPSIDLSPLAVVTDQSPESGAKARPGTPVRLWTERGGGSGVREPRRPRPTSLTGRKTYDEPTEEAVG